MCEKFRLAGKIAGEALKIGAESIKEGVSYLEVAEKIEEYIKKKAKIAFPVNISVNSVAAHYTPSWNDEKKFMEGDVVKIDVGTHVDGYIGDTALTVEVESNEHAKLIECAEIALENAISVVKEGIEIGYIGKVIEDSISKCNFKPIKNLQGHSIERYRLHAGISIPNYFDGSKIKLKEGQVVAIEPFVTTGIGYVVDAGHGNIYQVIKKSPLTSQLIKHFDGLPFAKRWLRNLYGERVEMKLNFLLKKRLIHKYNTLVEARNGIVSQAEHTLLVEKDGCEILTRR